MICPRCGSWIDEGEPYCPIEDMTDLKMNTDFIIFPLNFFID